MSVIELTDPVRPPLVGTSGGRLTCVDAVRGLVMVLMVLDHTRDFFTDASVNATDPGTSNLALFFTRWITHYCAPLFVFLAGASACLAGALGKCGSPESLGRYLLGRGFFLMLLELTLVRLGLFFSWSLSGMLFQVIWVIGLSLVLLALLVSARLSPRWVGVLGAIVVISHNILDVPQVATAIGANGIGGSGWYALLLRPGLFTLGERFSAIVAYPLLPWFGILALGYAFGPVLLLDRHRRVRRTATLGAILSLGFLALRALAAYGDPVAFRVRETPSQTLMAFLDCQKYPPSLLYAMMTLGPGLLVLAAIDAFQGRLDERGRPAGPLMRFLVTLGRVPLFYYLLQWPVLHGLMLVVNALNGISVPVFAAPFETKLPVYSLPTVYLMWVIMVAILYIPSRWYAGLKRRHKNWTWLSYL